MMTSSTTLQRPHRIARRLLLSLLLLPVACGSSSVNREHDDTRSSGEEPTVAVEVVPRTSAPEREPDSDSSEAPQVSARIELPGGIIVDREAREVVVPAEVSIDVGWLEQVVCSRHTRDHEAILVVDVLPSQVHAALMLLELEPGSPGRWAFETVEGQRQPRVRRIEPKGDRVAIMVRHGAPETNIEVPISGWIVGEDERDFPEQPWVFGGSFFHRPVPEAPEVYAADQGGSLVGLVTFGDEVLGLERVQSDLVGVDAAMWEARTAAVPKPGTRVELVLRPWDSR